MTSPNPFWSPSRTRTGHKTWKVWVWSNPNSFFGSQSWRKWHSTPTVQGQGNQRVSKTNQCQIAQTLHWKGEFLPHIHTSCRPDLTTSVPSPNRRKILPEDPCLVWRHAEKFWHYQKSPRRRNNASPPSSGSPHSIDQWCFGHCIRGSPGTEDWRQMETASIF